MARFRDRLHGAIARTLTKPRGNYNRILPNNMENLRAVLRTGDVVLIDGDQRVSEVIKYLTQSSWSHAALYVGDELVRRDPTRRGELEGAHGPDAGHIIIEALMDGGVVASPVSKYASCNLRLCRPVGLRREDLQRIVEEVVAQIGVQYDVKNVIDLARYFFPVSLIPRRLRRRALAFGSGVPTQVICSSMIARAFQNVGYPILPAMTPTAHEEKGRRWASWLRRERSPYPALFHRELPTLITPRDFDLSPYFEIVKFNALESVRFDYRRIRWA